MTPPRPPRALVAIRNRLRALMTDDEPDDDVVEAPSQRGLAMLLSLVVALVMWFSFSMREVYAVEMQMPVEIVRTPDGQALREAPPGEVEVELSGEGWTLLSLSRRLPTIQVAADEALVNLRGALRESGLPPNVSVVRVQPEILELALDTRTSRKLPIRLRSRIQTRSGYDLLRAPRLRPDSVTVTGAQSLLGSLDEWPTAVLEAEGVEGGLGRTIALADTFGGLLTPAVRATRVQIDVGQFTESFRDLPVEVENVPAGITGVRFEPATVTASYRTPTVGATYDQAQRSAGFRAVVDYFDIQRDTTDGQVPVSPRWPSTLDVRDVQLTPSRVGYFIQRPAAVVVPEEEQ